MQSEALVSIIIKKPFIVLVADSFPEKFSFENQMSAVVFWRDNIISLSVFSFLCFLWYVHVFFQESKAPFLHTFASQACSSVSMKLSLFYESLIKVSAEQNIDKKQSYCYFNNKFQNWHIIKDYKKRVHANYFEFWQ